MKLQSQKKTHNPLVGVRGSDSQDSWHLDEGCLEYDAERVHDVGQV